MSEDKLILELKQYSQIITSVLQDFFIHRHARAKTIDQKLESMVNVLEEYMLRGGKRIRAFLVDRAYQLAGGKNLEAIHRVSASVEMLHYYLLNIDDIADRDEMRHGGKTLELEYRDLFRSLPREKQMHYGRSFSEMSGALLQTYAYELLRNSGFDSQTITDVEGIFHQTMLEETITGWQIHFFQNLEELSEAKESEFMKGLELVSARYTFVGPMHIGLTCAHALDSLQKPVFEYASHVGIAFQIQDDILGVFGDSKETGKPVGNDVREGKKTLLMQYAYKHASTKEKAFLEHVCGSEVDENNIKQVQQIMIDTGSFAHSVELAKQEVQKGILALDTIPTTAMTGKEAIIEQLKQLAAFAVERKK